MPALPTTRVLLGIAMSLDAASLSAAAQTAGAPQPDTLAAARAAFLKPDRSHATAPLWVWNDQLTREQVLDSLNSLADQGVMQAFVHPRPGLITPYLGDDWFALWKASLELAERRDMNLWIYDENSYPSGFAGGHVVREMPEALGRGLHLRQSDAPPAWSDDTLAVFALADPAPRDVTAAVRAGESLPAGKYLQFVIARAPARAWTGGKGYVDLLYPGVTEKFLDITMAPYERHLGDALGRRIPGIFTDEPEILPAGGMPWTADLPEQFKQRWGYDLTAHLPSLFMPVGDHRRVRHNYFATLNDLFVERWAKPYHDYCARHGLEFTGHYWEHEWPMTLRVPDNMAMYAWHQRPAIDCLMNQYSEGPHAQFGNLRAVKELASIANQFGRPRTLCEAYGAGGWDLRFEDMKRIGDWLYVLGVNTLDEHLSYISLRGARKRDHPQSFSYHEPWWDHYRAVSSYFTRLSAAMSAGREVNDVVVIEPTTTAWMYNTPAADAPELKTLGESFQAFITDLAKGQVEFDLVSEDVLARHGGLSPGVAGKLRPWPMLQVGRAAYGTVVIAPHTESLNARTVELLQAFTKAGGSVLLCGDAPTRIDGADVPMDLQFGKLNIPEGVSPAKALTDLLRDQWGYRMGVRVVEASGGMVLHTRRRLDDGEIVLLTNTDLKESATTVIELFRGEKESAEVWDPLTGKCDLPDGRGWLADREFWAWEFILPPGGSKLIAVQRDASQSQGGSSRRSAEPGSVQPVAADQAPRVLPAADNILTLDYVDLRVGDERHEGLNVLKAARRIWEHHGYDGSPWDRAVQYKDELIRRTFPEGTGFEADYHFTIEGAVPAKLDIVIERPDLYAITCNGQPVAPTPGAWWLDRQFGRIDIAAMAKAGDNVVTIKASPMTMLHELEAAYLLGDFALKPVEKGFVVAPSQPLKLGPLNAQGRPLDAAGAIYRQTHRIEQLDGEAAYRVRLPDWLGSVATVTVNGSEAGVIWHQPYVCDVTAHMKVGENTVDVRVIGTLKNTLGPHHGNPPLGSAWPGMWDQAPEHGPPPGAGYHTVGYGLFAPFVLERLEVRGEK